MTTKGGGAACGAGRKMREEVEVQNEIEVQNEGAGVEGFELSPQQRRAWELLRAGGDGPYHAQLVVEIAGALDAGALLRAARETCARHEILRTAFRLMPGMIIPVQVVADEETADWSQLDLTELPPGEQERSLSEWLADARRPREEGEGVRSLRAALFALAPQRHALALSLPALCADRGALENLAGEIARGYAVAVRGETADEEPLQYADLAAWQNELAAAEESEPGRAYWRESLRLGAGATRPPWARRLGEAARFDPRVLEASAGADVSARLRESAARHDARVEDLLLACWQLLLRRLGAAADVTVGVRFGGRKYEELETAVGPLARYLPVAGAVDDESGLGDLVARAAAAREAAAKWQECFSWELVGAGGGADGAPPFMPLCFDFADDDGASEAAGLTFARARQYECVDQFHAKLVCGPRRGGDLAVELHYDGGALGVEEAGRLLEQFRTLLESVARNPEGRASEWEIVSESERRRLLFEFNEARADFGPLRTLHGLFEAQAARTPDAAAVLFEGAQLSYAELNERANRLAHHLRAQGVGPEALVGLCVERSFEMMVGVLGVLKAGAAYVPLDPEYPRERLDFMLEDAAFPVLLTQHRLLTRLGVEGGLAPRAGGEAERVICLDADWGAVAAESGENPDSLAAPDNLAYVIYTSGSTGRPKGVAVTHAAITNRLLWMQAAHPLRAEDRVLQKTAFSFDASVWELFVPLLAGAALVMARPGGHRDAAYLCEVINEQGVTTLQLVPTMLAVMLEEPAFAGCRSLRRVWCGGEAVSLELQRRFFSAFPDTELHNLYGPTETAIDATHWACERDSERGAVPIGRPLPNVRAYVLDRHLSPAPVGVAGELYVGGVQLARGYHGRPELTAERFIPDPLSGEAGARLYRTGDLARWGAGGVLEYLGRADTQVKVRGFRVELGEIEAALSAHDAVREAVVLAREDRPGDRRLVAYVVAAQGSAVAAEELRAYAAGKLPEYMIPSAFVVLDELPRAPNGKLDRRALPPPSAAAGTGEDFVAPRDNVELELAQVWEELLGIRPVGVRDNFFELGGHSLLALRVIGQVHKRFGKELPLAAMIQAGTIENLARMLRDEQRLLPWDPLVAVQPEGTKTPLFAVHSIGGQVFCYVALSRHLGLDQPFYGLQAPRLESVGDSHVSIEEMAAHYLNTMRDVQPEGPYLLCGYSFGAMVAFEIARQLRRQGQEVALLALLDARSPHDFNKLPPYEDDDAFMLALRGKVAAFEQGRTITISAAEFAGLEYEEMLKRFLKRMQDEDLFPPEHDLDFLRNFMQGYKARQKAMRFYHPDSYDGRITLFSASEIDPWLVEQFAKAGVDVDDPTAGWGDICADVEVFEVPGNHDRICYEPHVRVLAKRMRQVIERATSAGAGGPGRAGGPGGEGRAQGWAARFLRRE